MTEAEYMTLVEQFRKVTSEYVNAVQKEEKYLFVASIIIRLLCLGKVLVKN